MAARLPTDTHAPLKGQQTVRFRRPAGEREACIAAWRARGGLQRSRVVDAPIPAHPQRTSAAPHCMRGAASHLASRRARLLAALLRELPPQPDAALRTRSAHTLSGSEKERHGHWRRPGTGALRAAGDGAAAGGHAVQDVPRPAAAGGARGRAWAARAARAWRQRARGRCAARHECAQVRRGITGS